MTQVNFYNLPQDTEQMRKLFACRLTEKARLARASRLFVRGQRGDSE